MALHYDQMNTYERMFEEARQRGFDSYERGTPRHENPFADAPRQRVLWFEGWDDAYQLDRADL